MKNIVIGYPANLILKSSIFKCSKFLATKLDMNFDYLFRSSYMPV